MEVERASNNYLSQVSVKWNGRLKGLNGTQYRVVCYTGKGKSKALEGAKWKSLSETCLKTLQKKQPGITSLKELRSTELKGDDFEAVTEFLSGKIAGFDHVEIEKVPITTRLFEVLFGGFVRRSQANKLTERLRSLDKFSEDDLNTLNAQFKEDPEFTGVVNDFLDALGEGDVHAHDFFIKVSSKLTESKLDESFMISSFMSLYMQSEIGDDVPLNETQKKLLNDLLSNTEKSLITSSLLTACKNLRRNPVNEETNSEIAILMDDLRPKISAEQARIIDKIIEKSLLRFKVVKLLGKDFELSKTFQEMLKEIIKDEEGSQLLVKFLDGLILLKDETIKSYKEGKSFEDEAKIISVRMDSVSLLRYLSLSKLDEGRNQGWASSLINSLLESSFAVNGQALSEAYSFAIRERSEIKHGMDGVRYLAKTDRKGFTENQIQLSDENFKPRSESVWERVDYIHTGERPDKNRHLFSKGWFELELAHDLTMEKISFRVSLDFSRFVNLYGSSTEEKEKNCHDLMKFMKGYCNKRESENFFNKNIAKLKFIKEKEDIEYLKQELSRYKKEATLKLDQAVVSLGDPTVSFDGLTRTKPLPKQS